MRDESKGHAAAVGRFLALALTARRAELLRALEPGQYSHSVHLELPVTGVPDTSVVACSVWPEPPGRPVRLGIDVLNIDGQVLNPPLRMGVETGLSWPPESISESAAELLCNDEDDHRPTTIFLGAARWDLVVPAERQEVFRLDAKGFPVYRTVDTREYPYRMICARCGRVRYAKRNSLHQIEYCHVCTRQDRLRRRSLTQYQQRAARRQGRPRRLTPHEIDQIVEMVQEGLPRKEVAGRMGVTESAISKILQRTKAKSEGGSGC